MSDPKKKTEKPRRPDPGFRFAIPFFIVLALMTAIAFIIPLRPSVSQMEKRELAAFPDFSFEALADGSFFDDINIWFSDTFPGRDSWISLSSAWGELHGYSEISIQGEPAQPDQSTTVEIPVVTPRPVSTPAPENAEPTPTPEPTPEPDWGGIEMGEGVTIDLGPIIQIGDSAFNQLGFSKHCSERYAAAVSNIGDKLQSEGVRVISAPPCTSVGVMIEPENLAQLNCARQDEMLEFIHSMTSDSVIKVDTYTPMVEHNDEYIYYRTDHHWTALGAYYCYAEIMETIGMTPAALEDFECMDQGEFEGSLYWQAASPRKLLRDNVYSYMPKGNITMDVLTNGWPTEKPVITDASNYDVSNKYMCFISGDNAHSIIYNHDIPDAPKCVLVKGSYGNCFAPFLAASYSEVHIIDYRKYYQSSLYDYVLENDIDDVIILPYMIATQSEDGARIMEYLCR